MFVKICGITNEEDALLSVAMGADALGFVFAHGSVRQVYPDTVRDIVKHLPHGTVTVGVFRDERPERVIEIVNQIGLTGAQLHGREPVSEVRRIRQRLRFVIQAFEAGDPAMAAAANGPADVLLVDSPNPGSGRVFDWSMAEGVPGGVRLLLAGGLQPDNVAEAIRRVRPWGVDVSTGVEATPGRKDPRKVKRFVEAAKASARELADMKDVLVEPLEVPGERNEFVEIDLRADGGEPFAEAGGSSGAGRPRASGLPRDAPFDWEVD